jgi:hypothetical protein
VRVKCVVDTASDFPCAEGGHKLAWLYVLDEISSHSWRHDVSDLTVAAPESRLLEWALIGSQEDHATTLPTRCAKMFLVNTTRRGSIERLLDSSLCPSGDEIYVLSFGLMPFHWRHYFRLRRSALTVPRLRMSIYTLSSVLWSAPLRLSLAMRRSDWADRAGYNMRRSFRASRFRPAFYYLYISGDK